jgi:hypothetical protein
MAMEHLNHGPHCARGERGAALVEAAITIPLILVLCVGIFEFGRAFQTWQVLTNAAREGARMVVVPYANTGEAVTRMRTYMSSASLARAGDAAVTINPNVPITVGSLVVSGSEVIIDYPFQFMVLQPVVRLVAPSSTVGAPLTMRAAVIMRNEAQ